MILKKEDLHKYDLGLSLETLYAIEIGKFEYVKNTVNKIKRLSEEEYIFLRFDSVHTHIIKEEAKAEDTRKIWEDFKEARDYNIKFAQDRSDAIKEKFEDECASRVVSSFKFMNQQVKTTSSNLTGESGFTKTLQGIADYIVFSKYNNKEEETIDEDLKKEKARLTKINKRKRKEKEENRIRQIKESLKDVPSSYTRQLKQNPEGTTSVESFLEHNGLHEVDKKPNYIKVDRAIVDGKYVEGEEKFWDRISPKKDNLIPFYEKEIIKYKDFGISTIRQYQKEIKHLEALPFSVERKKVISNLKSEMRVSMECLRKIIHFEPTINIAEKISYDSWNHLSLRNIDTYIALIESYSELKKKYHSKVSTTMWCLLKDFEDLLQKTKWTEQEVVILNFILETGVTEHKAINEELQRELKTDIPQRTLSDWLNKNIPNKLAQTYEKRLEEWIWTYRRKGKYKTCSKCGEVKLAVDDRYFRHRKDSKDGFRGVCRACE